MIFTETELAGAFSSILNRTRTTAGSSRGYFARTSSWRMG